MQPEPPVNILLVDDQPENLLALEAVLSELGQKLVLARSGKEALKCLLDDEFAIVVLDVMMPGMNGFETAHLIRQRESTRHTPIIFLTAMYTEDSDESVAYSLGAVDFIIKPFVAEILKSKVSVFVDLFKKSREIQRQAQIISEIEKQRVLEEKERLETEKQLIRQELLHQEMEKELLEERSRQLQKADRLKTEFLANMSHEIRTPMNGVVGMAELLLHTPLSTEQREFARIIRESAQALLIIINDILDLSKIEAGKLELEVLDFELIPLVEGTAELLSEQAHERKLAVMTYIDPCLPRGLKGDSGRLRQVLLNLIGNAMKFTKQGEVVVEARRCDRVGPDGDVVVRFEIKDTGIGLTQEEIDRLFRPFSQADGSTTRRFGGTGLGLSISKRLVNLMGGQIGVESHPGRGSTFWFEVPFDIGQAGELQTRRDGLEDTRVIVIDDQESARTIIQSYVQSWQMSCDVCANVAEGLDKIRQCAKDGKPYDIVITDLNMPDMDGYKLLSEIKNDEALKQTAVFLCTGYDTKGLGAEAMQAGFCAYLTKPVQQSRLFNSIAKVMQADELAVPAASDSSVSSTESDGTKILVAEDNAVNQKVAILQLKRLGYCAVAVGSGKAALDEVLRKDYAILLMDCQMPDMDGFEATHAIRKAENLSGKHIPIIGLTAHAMEGDRDRCIASGMDDYLSKPTSLDKLAQMLKKWVSVPAGISPGSAGRSGSASGSTGSGSAGAPPASIESTLSPDLVPVFISSTASSMSEIKKGLQDRVVSIVVAKAHEIESAALAVGAAKVSAFSKELEMAGKQENWPLMEESFVNLEMAFHQLAETVNQSLPIAVSE